MENYQPPLIKSTQVMFKSINKDLNKFIRRSKLSGSESAFLIRNSDLSSKFRENNKKVLNCNETKVKAAKFFSPKMKNFKIPEVSKTRFNKLNAVKTNYSTNDGYLVHTFSIPNGFINIRHKETTLKKPPKGSFIVNPNLRPERKGLMGSKQYNSLKQLKKLSPFIPRHTKLISNSLNHSAIP